MHFEFHPSISFFPSPEEMDVKTQRRIGETVTEILRNADMGEMTEFKVRIAASNRLGIDLFGTEQKLFIRSVIEDFLLSSAEEIGGGGIGDGDANSDHPEKTEEMVLEEEDRDKVKNEVNELGNRFICKLSNKRSVTLNEFKGKNYVQIRDYYQKDGKKLPSCSGVALPSDQWLVFKQSIPAIEEAIKTMKSNLRTGDGGEEIRAVFNSGEATKNGDLCNSAEATENIYISSSAEATKKRDVPNSMEAIKKRYAPNLAKAAKNGDICNSAEATENRYISNSAEATKKGDVPNSVEAIKKRYASNIAKAAKNGDISSSAEATKNGDIFNSAEETKNGHISNSGEATKKQDVSNSAEATKNGDFSSSAEATKKGDMSNSAEATKKRFVPNLKKAAKNRDIFNSVEATKNRDVSSSANATKNVDISSSAEATKNSDMSNSAEATKTMDFSDSAKATRNGDVFNSAEATKYWDVSNFAEATMNGGVSGSDRGEEAVAHEFVPIRTTRFDGKNYHSWAAKMEFFLNQLNIAYVLTDPSPIACATDQKWASDDHLCRHCILNALSDPLYDKFSNKPYSAKELWEELRLVYLYEEHGTKRSHVRKYMEFQIFDGQPVYEQVEELNRIADDILASGMGIDENFHVSAIISKLPASWKDVANKLMREENLPFWLLKERLKFEQDSRDGEKHGEYSRSAGFKGVGPGQRPGDLRKPGLSWKRPEPEMHRKALACSNCGLRGHVAKVCWHRKGDAPGRSSPTASDVTMVEKNVE